jgi:hypothetical protein
MSHAASIRIRVAGCDGGLAPARMMSPSRFGEKVARSADEARADSGSCVSASPDPSPQPPLPAGESGARAPTTPTFALDPAWHRVRAGCALLCRGPCAAVRDGRPARRGIGRMPIPFRRYTDVPSKSQAMTHGLSGHGCPESAKRGGLSLWLLSLWPRKEKVTRAPQAHESSCLHSTSRRKALPSALPGSFPRYAREAISGEVTATISAAPSPPAQSPCAGSRWCLRRSR